MKLSLPKWLRVVVYVGTGLLTPVVFYAEAKGWIGAQEVQLWGAEVAAASTLAAVKALTPDSAELVSSHAPDPHETGKVIAQHLVDAGVATLNGDQLEVAINKSRRGRGKDPI